MQREKLIFLAGLPRSGSTVLGALLNQNPRFHTEPASPILDLITSTNKTIEKNEHYAAFPKQRSVFAVIQALFQAYYWDISEPVIFDKNRGWPTQIRGLEQCVVPKAKIICPVRNVDEILASFLKIAHKNPYNPELGTLNFIDRNLVMAGKRINDEKRCEMLLSDRGLVGQCLNSLREALDKGYADRLHFVEYDDLISNPQETLNKLYDFIEEEHFEHDFSSIHNPSRERDAEVFAVPNLHEVSPKLQRSKTNAKKTLPKEVYESVQGKEFWRKG